MPPVLDLAQCGMLSEASLSFPSTRRIVHLDPTRDPIPILRISKYNFDAIVRMRPRNCFGIGSPTLNQRPTKLLLHEQPVGRMPSLSRPDLPANSTKRVRIGRPCLVGARIGVVSPREH